MRFTRVTVHRDTFVPANSSKEQSSRLNDFSASLGFEMWKEGDTLYIRKGTETNALPWSACTGAMVLPEPDTKPEPGGEEQAATLHQLRPSPKGRDLAKRGPK